MNGQAGPPGPPGPPGPVGGFGGGAGGLGYSNQFAGGMEKGPAYNQYQYRYYRSDREEERKMTGKRDVDDFIDELEDRLDAYTRPDGSRKFPAKTCKDLKLAFPDSFNGDYYLDTSIGSPVDMYLATCNFDNLPETCVKAKVDRINKRKWIKTERDGFQWLMEELNTVDEELEYAADSVQLELLRMAHKNIHQNITYHCKNSHAHKDSSGRLKSYIKFLSDDNIEMTTTAGSTNRLKVLSDSCDVKDGLWHKTVFEVNTRIASRLPIIDIAVFDVAHDGEEFGIDVGPVCFS